jgi:hypothetical protein
MFAERARAAAALLALGASVAGAHPMHTAVADVAFDAARGAAAITIRVFGDDLSAALGSVPGEAADSALSRYVRGRFAIRDRTGRNLTLRWDGSTREGDVVLLRLRVAAPRGLAGGRVASALLCERFEDQVNVVRISEVNRTVTLLFVRGDASKAIP